VSAEAEILAGWVEQVSAERAEQFGTWDHCTRPEDAEAVAGHLVVATVNEKGDPELEVYDPDFVRRWVAGVRAYRGRHPGATLAEALDVGRPEE
jgi:hypothetical protein